MKKQYIALIHKEDNSDFGVLFPDFLGCITAGTTLDEAYAMAQDALQLHIEGMLEDNDEIPEPMNENDIDQDYYDQTFVQSFYVEVDISTQFIQQDEYFKQRLTQTTERTKCLLEEASDI